MKYNEKYDRYVTTGGLVYRYDAKQDKLVLCGEFQDNKGYIKVKTKIGSKLVHRLVHETFVGEIPQGYEIDHEDTHPYNNDLSNLKLCTHKENMNNPKTRKRQSESHKGNTCAKGKVRSEFGKKYFEHFGYGFIENKQQYYTERKWYVRHNNTCRWEK